MSYKILKRKIKQIMINYFLKPELRQPGQWYKLSDERDKFQHISEAVNYMRVAEMPNVFFEFGCSSGRTFSAVLLAAKYFRVVCFGNNICQSKRDR